MKEVIQVSSEQRLKLAARKKNDSIKHKGHVSFHFILENRLQITLFQAFNS